MDEEVKVLMFLVDEYGMQFSKQTIKNYPRIDYTTQTYSFYNKSGCFTISYLAARDELEFYYSRRFSCAPEELFEKPINIWIDDPEIWDRHKKWLFGIQDPFFWWKKRKVIDALAEVIRKKISANGKFFDIKIR